MRLGPYEITGQIGHGGMGTVLRGRAPDGRDVAIKVLRPGGSERAARFERERRLLSSLGEDEGFVPLLDVGEGPHGPWIAMPFVGGGTLRDRLGRVALSVADVTELAEALARAIGAAHARGIVHRDLKPENILYTTDGRPLIADLGLAKHFAGAGSERTAALSKTGEMRGSVGYMPLEQFQDAREVGPSADVFALAVILYECLTGEGPFAGPTPQAIIARLEDGSFSPLRRLRPETPAALAAAIESALARDPARRPPDGHAFARAMARRVAAPRAALVAVAVVGVALAVAVVARGRSLPADAAPRMPLAPPPASSPARDALSLASRADEALTRRDDAGALELATRALALDDRCVLAYIVRGELRERRGDVRGAIDDATRAIALDPRCARAWSNRAVPEGKSGDVQRALDDCARAIDVDPSYARGYLHRGIVRGKLGDADGEIEDYSKALELDPYLVSAWANRAAARGDRNDLDGQLADATRALELDPKQVPALTSRGAAWWKKGRPADALAELTKAVELEPDSAQPRIFRARVRHDLHDDAGAAEDLKHVLAVAPDDPDAAVVRGMLADLERVR